MTTLFEPGTIGKMDIKNRFVRSATVELLATDDGRVTDKYLKAYKQLARGGVGLIITGTFYLNPIGQALPRSIVMHRDEIVDDLRKVVKTVHEHGAKVVAQINHAGRQCNPNFIKQKPIAPSAVRDMMSLVKPRQMTLNEIEETITAYGDAARKVKEAGFDGVQIHGAHGYLINQFLSCHTNRRKDEWGGSLDNRMRFLIRVYGLIRETVGPDYPVLIKINGEDCFPNGLTIDQSLTVCEKLDELGIDAIEVSGGIGETGFSTIRGDIPRDLLIKNRNIVEKILIRLLIEKKMRKNAEFSEAYFLPFATAVKKKVNVPVVSVGGIRLRQTMENILKNKDADFISLSRPFIRQPNIVNQFEKGEKDPITCDSCNRCTFEMIIHHKPMRCYNKDTP